jgi:hypothetical protein
MCMITHDDTKLCRICNTIKKLSDFKPSKVTKDGFCKDCKDCWLRRWKEHRKKTALRFYQKHKKKIREWHHKRRKEKQEYDKSYRKEKCSSIKREVFDFYGGKCECCGESILDFLAIDHINGDGSIKRKRGEHFTGDKMYRWLKKNNYPEGLRVLCHNCNWGAYVNGGVCPHKNKTKEEN